MQAAMLNRLPQPLGQRAVVQLLLLVRALGLRPFPPAPTLTLTLIRPQLSPSGQLGMLQPVYRRRRGLSLRCWSRTSKWLSCRRLELPLQRPVQLRLLEVEVRLVGTLAPQGELPSLRRLLATSQLPVPCVLLQHLAVAARVLPSVRHTHPQKVQSAWVSWTACLSWLPAWLPPRWQQQLGRQLVLLGLAEEGQLLALQVLRGSAAIHCLRRRPSLRMAAAQSSLPLRRHVRRASKSAVCMIPVTDRVSLCWRRRSRHRQRRRRGLHLLQAPVQLLCGEHRRLAGLARRMRLV